MPMRKFHSHPAEMTDTVVAGEEQFCSALVCSRFRLSLDLVQHGSVYAFSNEAKSLFINRLQIFASFALRPAWARNPANVL
jgi:hypothetical protein